MTTDDIRTFLQEHAAARDRIADDHMFRVEEEFSPLGTFRLQVFTAAGQRPVAVATQTMGEGSSLTNSSERYAAAAWEQHFSNDTEPPIWVERQILPSGDFDFFQLVTFTHAGRYTLTDPSWSPLTDEQLTQLVGTVVDHSRGDGYVPRPAEPEEHPSYPTRWLIRFPRPRPFREDCMKGGLSLRRRLSRQLIPDHTARDCCWYHGGDWHHVCEAAIRLVRHAQRDRILGDDIPGHVLTRPEVRELSEWERQALYSLFHYPLHLSKNRRSYVNGQHRAQAMLDLGVRRTIVIKWTQET